MKLTVRILLLLASAICFSCARDANPTAANGQGAPTPAAEAKKRPFEEDLEYIKISDFDLIYVLRRKDGQPIGGEDGSFIRANSPLETNRRVMADEGRAVIIGSNFRYTQEQLAALKGRFDFQDLSPVREPDANMNTNADKNKNAPANK